MVVFFSIDWKDTARRAKEQQRFSWPKNLPSDPVTAAVGLYHENNSKQRSETDCERISRRPY